MSGILSIVATPIGNLEDITLRALRVLREAEAVIAEDTRRTAILLQRHGIARPVESCPAFREASACARVVERIAAGERLALVSDAGTPGISDPGARIVRACVARGLAVEVIPGPCAAVAALCGSGLPTHEFHFVGFLPPKAVARERRLRELATLPGTLVIYESPHRLCAMLGQAAGVFGARPAAVARELTKKFEEFRRGTSAELAAWFATHPPKGEIVFLVGPGHPEQRRPTSL
ncbi:MAG: 16S rRNA (cytidine(1402)-2'-O)-methyltransferase [Verrucomicrobiae bacterium]|nr:16S rRNA (cytidine(1402)-2'-O)-methyltransferase [Verrucomicrobiae bacterium]